MDKQYYRLNDDQLEKLNNGECLPLWIGPGGSPRYFDLCPPEGRIKVGELKRLREETGAGLRTVKLLLDDHSYDEAKQMVLDVLVEINKRGRPGDWTWSPGMLESLPVWKRDLIERSLPG